MILPVNDPAECWTYRIFPYHKEFSLGHFIFTIFQFQKWLYYSSNRQIEATLAFFITKIHSEAYIHSYFKGHVNPFTIQCFTQLPRKAGFCLTLHPKSPPESRTSRSLRLVTKTENVWLYQGAYIYYISALALLAIFAAFTCNKEVKNQGIWTKILRNLNWYHQSAWPVSENPKFAQNDLWNLHNFWFLKAYKWPLSQQVKYVQHSKCL